MNYRQAGIYTDRSTIELKTEFEDIIEAMGEIGQSKEITHALLDFWLHGSVPTNNDIYLQQLHVEKLLKDNGIPAEHIKNSLGGNAPLDKYTLFKNACLNFIGEDLTPDFKTLVIEPLIKHYVMPSEASKKHKLKQLEVARKTIKRLSPSIDKSIAELSKIEPYVIAGTFEETILIKLQQIEHLIVNQIATS